jgi:hypothetical protein
MQLDESRLWQMLGNIEKGVSNLEDGQRNLFSRMGHMEANGCAKGEGRETRITKLESNSASNNSIKIGNMTVSGSLAVVVVVVGYLFLKVHGVMP